ncbi:MAG TPA: M28 family peptidase [Acidobacteriaceae bacterium]|nr:M28 family peptidase [Acidobacteriaceae bacterium]
MPRRLTTTAVLLFLLAPGAFGQSAHPDRDVARSSVPDPSPAASPPAAPATPAREPAVPAPPPDTALPPPGDIPASEASPKSKTLFFFTSPRSTVEMEVHTIPASDAERLQRLRDNFSAASCSGGRMHEESVTDRHGEKGVNLVCMWPGHGSGVIVVVAHYEHEGQGQGALADWSGAVLLPFLYQAIQGQPRENTYVFLETWKREGADAWLRTLSREDRKRLRAVIDLDGLGLSYTRFFTTFSPFESVPAGSTHLQTQLLWSALSDGLTQPPEQVSPHHWLTVDNTDPFRAIMVPTIVIHSVPSDSGRLPGSASDIASAVNGNAYFTTYHLMCAFLTSLDHVAAKLDSNDRIWQTVGPIEVQPEQETPVVTFRSAHGGHLAPPPTNY